MAASFRRLTTQVYAMSGDLEEAQDCVQEAFARAWSRRPTLDHAQHPEAWVRTTAYRLAVSRWRRTVADVAREVGTPEGTIKARLSRGRAALALLLAEGTSHA